jgi:RNA polymerase sigma-70 factor (ECF subfamily)
MGTQADFSGPGGREPPDSASERKRGDDLQGKRPQAGEQRPDEFFQTNFAAARDGSKTALGRLFDLCRNYLLLVANRNVGESIQGKIGASDLVQETFLQAQQIFGRFEGTTQEELLAWLTRILQFKLAQAVDQFAGTQMRDVGRELPMVSGGVEPVSDQRRSDARSAESAIEQFENQVRLNAALDRLSADHRAAIELRSLQQKSFAEVGQVLGRSADAARKLWVRAVEQLQEVLRSEDSAWDQADLADSPHEQRLVDT